MAIKFPKFRLPKLITTREETGKKQFIGLTGSEWVLSTGALCFLYIILAGFFAALLVIAQAVRHGTDHLVVPGTDALQD